MNKKRLKVFFLILIIVFTCYGCENNFFKEKDREGHALKDPFPKIKKNITINPADNIAIDFKATEKYFYHNQDGIGNFVYLQGVNMGLTEATTDLSNPNVSYETYIEWFNQIADMNANTIKVFSIMNPNFYNAFFDYNQLNADKPLYLLQGVWFNEDYMYSLDNAYSEDGKIIKAFKRSIKETIDILHGNSNYTTYGEFSPAIYENDISKYVVGFVLGLEWYPDFVINTNKITNKEYHGKYLKSAQNSPSFEVFLCEIGDYLISYETNTYHHQTPVAFLNWSTTDVLKHTNEPFAEEDAVSVDTECVLSMDAYHAGLFAAIDIYPYYPEFLNHQKEYTSFVDFSGKKNPYRAYLRDLQSTYTVPVMIAEFGVPTSRGIAHESFMGYNQGGITEQQQGEFVIKMMDDIIKEGYCGGMIFSWQDEWFKQTWNTIKYYPENPKLRSPNVMSAEQSYGILAMEAGTEPTCYVDGNDQEWENTASIYETSEYNLKTKYDSAYLYLNITMKNAADFESKKIYLPISTIGIGSEFSNDLGLKFSENADFLLVVDGKDNTRLLTDAYYDSFYYLYSEKKNVFLKNNKYRIRNSGIYNQINFFISNEIVLPVSEKTIEPKYYESGKFVFGNANPEGIDFNNLADFCVDNNIIEMRIPWYLLNIQNANLGIALGDFYQNNDIVSIKFDEIKIGICENQEAILNSIHFNTCNNSSFHTRIKKSYDIIKKYFSNIMFENKE